MSIAYGTVPDGRLRSLGIFLDVVFALIFFRIVEFLSSFQDGHWVQLPHGLLGLLASSPANLTRVIFRLMMTVYYWYRKNIFLSLLARSNGILATLAIASLFFVCLFMYALVADPTYAGGVPTLLLQSVSILIGSFLSFFALLYAIRAGLVRYELRLSAEQFARVDLINPLAALVAAGLSWSGLTIWTLSWFIQMPLFAWLLARRK